MPSEAPPQVPGLIQILLFEVRAAGLRAKRWVTERLDRAKPRTHTRGSDLIGAVRIAKLRSPLWGSSTGIKDRELTAGKVQNLRLALRGLDGIEVPAGEVFSFWRQVGRPTRRRGFVDGRELREGCLIASPGGGLCQLSNALYEAAMRAGFEIVERHAHSRIVPGSRAALGRDATVFWNYVDLRFRASQQFRIEASMSGDALVVTFRVAGARIRLPKIGAAEVRDTKADIAHDCVACSASDCRRHIAGKGEDRGVTTAWLVDACSPEFSALLTRMSRPEDALILPTRRFGAGRYGWPTNVCRRESSATLTTLQRSLALRRAGHGAALQVRSLAADARMAASYAKRLSYRDTHVVVALNLLPHLWRLGVLQGRRISVLADRLPIDVLQQRLDEAAQRYPHSPTLADFRAPADVVDAERAALKAANVIYTAHPDIAACFPGRSVQLDWAAAAAMPARRGGKTVLLPTSALARKGAYALRAALDSLDLDLAVAGHAVEGPDFWADLPVRVLGQGERPTEIAAVVLPAIVEHQPRTLLAALAAGIPVIATPACGLDERPGLTLVAPMDATALRDALINLDARPRRADDEARPSVLSQH